MTRRIIVSFFLFTALVVLAVPAFAQKTSQNAKLCEYVGNVCVFKAPVVVKGKRHEPQVHYLFQRVEKVAKQPLLKKSFLPNIVRSVDQL